MKSFSKISAMFLLSVILLLSCQAETRPLPSAVYYISTNGNRVALIHFGYKISSDEATKEMRKLGLVPADYSDFADLVKGNYDNQPTSSVVIILGAVETDQTGRVWVKYSQQNSPHTHSDWYETNWGANCRFLCK